MASLSLDDIGNILTDPFAATETLEWVNQTKVPVVAVEYYMETPRHWWVLKPGETKVLDAHRKVDIRIYPGDKEPDAEDVVESLICQAAIDAVKVAVAVLVGEEVGALAACLAPIAAWGIEKMTNVVDNAEGWVQDQLLDKLKMIRVDDVDVVDINERGQNIKIINGPDTLVPSPHDWKDLGYEISAK